MKSFKQGLRAGAIEVNDSLILEMGLNWRWLVSAGGSDGKVSGCNAGDLGLTPWSGRCPG